MKKSSAKHPKLGDDEDKCEKCGRSKSSMADDYFIPKCWCDDILAMELLDYIGEVLDEN